MTKLELYMKETVLDARIEKLEGWRGQTLAKMRQIIRDADPEVVEEWKWVKPTSAGIPVWSHSGIICTGETYKGKVKMTFAKGAWLKDPSGLFNSSLDGNVRRAIDIYEGDEIDEGGFEGSCSCRSGSQSRGQELFEAPASGQKVNQLTSSLV